MVFVPPGEKVVETKRCRLSGQEFIITDKDLEFYDNMSPILAGKKYAIPAPTVCPSLRYQHRLAWRNERKLYTRKCDATGVNIVSIHHVGKDFPVYDPHYWWSDSWDAMDFGGKFDFSRSFFSQFHELYDRVPQLGVNSPKSENCDYTNQCEENKDCYLIFSSGMNRDCHYGMWYQHSENSIDCLYLELSRHCYQVVNGKNCYNCFWSQNLENCSDCYYSRGLIGCKNCYGCCNLINKEFCFGNKQLQKSDYEAKVAALSPRTYEDSEKNFTSFNAHISRGYPFKCYLGGRNEGFTGDYLWNNNNAFDAYNCRNSRDIKYCYDAWNARNCHDLAETLENDFCYQVEGSYANTNCSFGMKIPDTHSSLYLSHCYFSQNLFGCVGLRSKKHAILNTAYSVQEYETLAGKVIDHMCSTGEWGEYFPIQYAPFGYNESVAQEYFPLTESEVKERGWNWYNEPDKFASGETIAPLPISSYDEKIVGYELAQKNIDALLSGMIVCSVSGKAFKIIKQELIFYIKHHLPIPTKHHDQRHGDRMKLRNPRLLHEGTCQECQKAVITTYSPERTEKIVCEECYRKLVH